MPGPNHFYTTSATERDAAIANYGYEDEGVACYVYPSLAADTTPFYRLFSRPEGDHFYTTSATERDAAIANHGYEDEGVACYVHTSLASGTTPFYRLLNSEGNHFYTTSATERDAAIANHGYRDEGVACYVYPSLATDTTPFYRLFNKPGPEPTPTPPVTTDSQTHDTAIRYRQHGTTWWMVKIEAFKNNYIVFQTIGIEVSVYRWAQLPVSDLWSWRPAEAHRIDINNTYAGEVAGARYTSNTGFRGNDNDDYVELKLVGDPPTVRVLTTLGLQEMEVDSVTGIAEVLLLPDTGCAAQVSAP